MLHRKSGVLMPISALPGNYSIGGFSAEARHFVDFLADCGFSYWQVLPFGMADEYNSPYRSYSAFAGNPYYVDPETLAEKGLLTKKELSEHQQESPYFCEYNRLYQERRQLLMAASRRVTEQKAIAQFIKENPPIEEFCRFMALKEVNGERCWIDWTENKAEAETLFMWQFVQYEFFSQWEALKTYANDRGIQIIGDVPFYVSFDSADVWANRHLFCLDKAGHPTCVAGVPPDYFSQDGQLWGNPLYDWSVMKEDGFSWWKRRMLHMLSLFDGVRIDHFRALASYYGVPSWAKTAREGQWLPGPGKAFVDMVNDLRGEKLIIAEDLGDITDAVRDLLAYSGFPGMRVFQFGFLNDDDSYHKPHHYVKHCVAYTGTHDNNTLLGYLWELEDRKRREMLEYCGYVKEDFSGGFDYLLRTVFMSHADLVILPIQDLLGFGADTRFNVPGQAEGNWQFRITREQLDGIDREKFKRLNELYKR